MSDFQPGDKVTVTNPVQPTRFTGGETATVIRTGFSHGMVQIEDEYGVRVGVYPQEIAKQ